MNDVNHVQTYLQREAERARKYFAKAFGIPLEDITWANQGFHYDRVSVKTKASADKITAAVKGLRVEGGFFAGMPLGGQIHYHAGTPEEHYEVTC